MRANVVLGIASFALAVIAGEVALRSYGFGRSVVHIADSELL